MWNQRTIPWKVRNKVKMKKVQGSKIRHEITTEWILIYGN